MLLCQTKVRQHLFTRELVDSAWRPRCPNYMFRMVKRGVREGDQEFKAIAECETEVGLRF